MSITFRCPGCQQRYTTPDSMAGMSTPCKKCGIAVVIPSPATPPPQASPLNLTDLLEEAAAASGSPPAPAQFTVLPLGPTVRKRPRSRGRIEWRTVLKQLVRSPVRLALLVAFAGLVVFLMLWISPAAAGNWAKLCVFIGMGMAVVGGIWHLCAFFLHSSHEEVFVLVIFPIVFEIISVITIPNLKNHPFLVTFVGIFLACNVALFVYYLRWLVVNWRWVWRCVCVSWLGVMMMFGAAWGVRVTTNRQGDQVVAAPDRGAENAAQPWADARREIAPFVPQPVPRPADFPPPRQPFGDLATNPAPGPDRPAVGPNPAWRRPMEDPAERFKIPGPAIGPGPGRLVPDRFGPRVRPGRPGFGPPGIPAARRGRATDLIGGSGGGSFETPGSGEPVLGFDYRLGSWAGQEAMADFRPIYARGPQRAQPPFARGPLGAQQVMARDGYAVGALEVDAAEFVNAVRVVFMRVDAQGRLDRNDSYKSDWIGAASGRPIQTLGGDGSKIIGIYGRRTAVLDAVGLLLE